MLVTVEPVTVASMITVSSLLLYMLQMHTLCEHWYYACSSCMLVTIISALHYAG
jgi:hypothetical protein